MDSIQLSYPDYFLFFIAVIALFYALGLYINESKLKENKSWLPGVLGVLRFLSVLGILFLLLSPLIKQILTEEEKPINVIVRDVSTSISTSTDSIELDRVESALDQLKSQTGERYSWVDLYFGQDISDNPVDSLNRLSSNLSKPLEYVSEIYEDQNLGAVIMVSDGIYNVGKNPLYADLSMTAPVHTIALGDTSQRRDILVKNILHNRIVYLNDEFQIEADIQAYNAAGSKTTVYLYALDGDRRTLLDKENINIKGNSFFTSLQFDLKAERTGNRRYLISIGEIPNELSTRNNYRTIYIEVLDARQKVLLLCHSTHPDIKVLKNIISSNINYEIDVAYASDYTASIKAYDIVIMHNLPSRTHPVDQVLAECRDNKMPIFFITGNATDRDMFNQSNDVVSITGENFNLNNVTPTLNPGFKLFTYSEELENRITDFVPLKAPFGDFKAGPSSFVFLNQKIGSVETPYPLLAYSSQNGHRQAVLCGEGIWRWSLMEYYESESAEITQEILFKSIQYISQKEDKRQFRAFTNKRIYQENQSVSFDAQLYNDNYELVTAAEVALSVTNENNERFDYIFSKNGDYYVVDAGRFPEGSYNYQASTNYNGKSLKASGSFTVQSIMKENYDLTARHDILSQLSKQTNGVFMYPTELASLDSLITNNENIKTIMYQKASTRSILNWPWLLFILLALLSIEWFARRYFGSY